MTGPTGPTGPEPHDEDAAQPGDPQSGDYQPGEPDPFRELRRVARAASDELADAVGPYLDRRPAGEAEPAPYPLLLWQLTKALGFAAPDPGPDTETFEATVRSGAG